MGNRLTSERARGCALRIPPRIHLHQDYHKPILPLSRPGTFEGRAQGGAHDSARASARQTRGGRPMARPQSRASDCAPGRAPAGRGAGKYERKRNSLACRRPPRGGIPLADTRDLALRPDSAFHMPSMERKTGLAVLIGEPHCLPSQTFSLLNCWTTTKSKNTDHFKAAGLTPHLRCISKNVALDKAAH